MLPALEGLLTELFGTAASNGDRVQEICKWIVHNGEGSLFIILLILAPQCVLDCNMWFVSISCCYSSNFLLCLVVYWKFQCLVVPQIVYCCQIRRYPMQ